MTTNEPGSRTAPLEMSPDEFRAGRPPPRRRDRRVPRVAPVAPRHPRRDAERAARRSCRRPCPERGAAGRAAARSSRAAPRRALALQRPPALLRLHHVLGGADRRARRSPGLGREPERRRLAALADGDARSRARRVRWIAELLGLPAGDGGAPRQRRQHGELRRLPRRAPREGRRGRAREGRRHASGPLTSTPRRRRTPGSQKAADLFGLGTEAIRWIAPVRDDLTRRPRRARAHRSRTTARAGCRPFLVVGTAGTVSTGRGRPAAAASPRSRREHGPVVPRRRRLRRAGRAAATRRRPTCARASRLADSVAVDPHKWLYAPLEAGCALVRHPARCATRSPTRRPTTASTARRRTRASTTSSSGRRTRAASARSRSGSRCGRPAATGYRQMIGDDIRLARALDACVRTRAASSSRGRCGLSIATFRYVPADLVHGRRERRTRSRSTSTGSTRSSCTG